MTNPFCLTWASIRSTQSLITSGRTGSLASFSTRLDIHASLQSVARTIVRGPRGVQLAAGRPLLVAERHAVARTAGAHLLLIPRREPSVIAHCRAAIAVDTRRRDHDAQHADVAGVLCEHPAGDLLGVLVVAAVVGLVGLIHHRVELEARERFVRNGWRIARRRRDIGARHRTGYRGSRSVRWRCRLLHPRLDRGRRARRAGPIAS